MVINNIYGYCSAPNVGVIDITIDSGETIRLSIQDGHDLAIVHLTKDKTAELLKALLDTWEENDNG